MTSFQSLNPIAAIFYSPELGGDVPVWEMTHPHGERFLLERKSYPGVIPHGCLSRTRVGSSMLLEFPLVIPRRNEHLKVYTEKQLRNSEFNFDSLSELYE